MTTPAADLVRWCRANRVVLRVRADGVLEWLAPPKTVTDDLAARLRAHEAAVIAVLRRRTVRLPPAPEETAPMPDPKTPSPIEAMFASVMRSLEASADVGKRRAAAIVEAAQHYAGAFERKVAAEFAARMAGTRADTAEADAAALRLMELVNELPELQAPAPLRVVEEPTSSPAPLPDRPPPGDEFTHVRLACARGGLSLVGSNRVPALETWLRLRVGNRVRWRHMSKAAKSPAFEELRIELRDGGTGPVVLLASQLASWQVTELAATAAKAGVPCHVADGADAAALQAALEAIERKLAA